jgi:hypothetical protein
MLRRDPAQKKPSVGLVTTSEQISRLHVIRGVPNNPSISRPASSRSIRSSRKSLSKRTLLSTDVETTETLGMKLNKLSPGSPKNLSVSNVPLIEDARRKELMSLFTTKSIISDVYLIIN